MRSVQDLIRHHRDQLVINIYACFHHSSNIISGAFGFLSNNSTPSFVIAGSKSGLSSKKAELEWLRQALLCLMPRNLLLHSWSYIPDCLQLVNFVSSINSFGLARQKLSVFVVVIALFADSRLNLNVDSGVNLNVKWISRNYNNRAHTCANYAVKLNHP